MSALSLRIDGIGYELRPNTRVELIGAFDGYELRTEETELLGGVWKVSVYCLPSSLLGSAIGMNTSQMAEHIDHLIMKHLREVL